MNFVKMMAQVTKEHIKKENFMDLDCVLMKMEIFMKENGVRVICMDMENLIIKTGCNMLEMLKMIRDMVKEFLHTQMVTSMMENGVKIINME